MWLLLTCVVATLVHVLGWLEAPTRQSSIPEMLVALWAGGSSAAKRQTPSIPAHRRMRVQAEARRGADAARGASDLRAELAALQSDNARLAGESAEWRAALREAGHAWSMLHGAYVHTPLWHHAYASVGGPRRPLAPLCAIQGERWAVVVASRHSAVHLPRAEL